LSVPCFDQGSDPMRSFFITLEDRVNLNIREWGV